jgi:hypothetical protein
MPISDAQVAALRAFLVLDTETTVPLAYQLGDEGLTGYQHLANAALSLLACQCFPRYADETIIRYVASVRAKRIADGDTYDFNPAVGENVIRFSLGKEVPSQHAEERLRAVVALLDDLSGSELSSTEDVEMLLRDARVLADRWLAANGE